MSKRSHFCDLQKYGAPNSSLRQMICAPRRAASRTSRSALARLAARSLDASSWMMPMVKGSLDIATAAVCRLSKLYRSWPARADRSHRWMPRQHDGEGGPVPIGRPNADRTIVRVHDLARNEQPETNAVGRVLFVVHIPTECLEDLRLHALRNRRADIVDRNGHGVWFCVAHRDGDRCVRSMLDRVADQVRQHLGDAVRVADGGAGSPGVQIDLLVGLPEPQLVDDRLTDPMQVDRLHPQPEAHSGPNPGEIEDLADQAPHPVRTRQDAIDGDLVVSIQAAAPQDLSRHVDRRERTA